MKQLLNEWRKQLEEFKMTGLPPGGYTPGAAEEPAEGGGLGAEGYLAKIKGGDKDVWNDLRNAMEGDMAGVGDIMTKEEAGALVLQIADLLVKEA